MVAAHIWDMHGAAKVGMKTIYIPRGDEQAGVGEVKSKKDGGEVDLVIHSFTELADIIGPAKSSTLPE